MNYIQGIETAKSFEALKSIGIRLFREKLEGEEKNTVLSAYRAKLRQIDREMVDRSENTYLKKLLFEINNMPSKGIEYVGKVGKTIHELCAMSDVFTKHESDLLFRSYAFQKKKAGIAWPASKSQDAITA